jgi:hypothetical protein
MKTNLTINTTSEADTVLLAVRKELQLDDPTAFLLNFFVGLVMGRVGVERAAEIFTELVAATRTMSGEATVAGKTVTFRP